MASTEADELFFFTINESSLWGPQSRGEYMRQNLLKKMQKGTFDASKAPKMFEYLMDDAAKMYAKGSGTTWNRMFTKADRREAAVLLTDYFLDSYGEELSPNGIDVPDRVEVNANLWRDTSGNTYHVVYVDVIERGTREQLVSGITYGYGTQYEQTALNMLMEEGYVPSHVKYGHRSLRYVMEDLGIPFSSEYDYVKRKKDL